MKYFIFTLIAIAAGLIVFNASNIDLDSPFQGESTVALICTVAAICVIVLMAILLVSRKISKLVK
jgi:hypothetical protein